MPSDFAGLWFSDEPVGGQAWVIRARLVSIYPSSHAQAAEQGLAVDFGHARETWKAARAVAIGDDARGTARLTFETASGLKVVLAKENDRLVGHITEAQARHALTVTRSTLAEIHGWIAQNPGAKAKARKDSGIDLLYVSAADCVHCQRWAALYLRNGSPKDTLGWDDVRFWNAHIGSYKGRFRLQDTPSHLQPAIEKLLKDNERQWLSGTPWYVLFVNGEIRGYAFGTTSFETLIHPGLRAALKERAADRGL